MSVETGIWRARIGLHSSLKFSKKLRVLISWRFFIEVFIFLMLLLVANTLLFLKNIIRYGMFALPKIKSNILPFFWSYYILMLCNDIHKNPGPSKEGSLKLLHWNLNSIKTENYSRVSLIESFNANLNYDFIGLSETALHQTDGNERLHIEGYYPPIRRDILSTG